MSRLLSPSLRWRWCRRDVDRGLTSNDITADLPAGETGGLFLVEAVVVAVLTATDAEQRGLSGLTAMRKVALPTTVVPLIS